jgi:hypothetical protein
MYNTTGVNNTAIGMQALTKNISGSENVAVGLNALFENTTGYNNTASGFYAMSQNTSGTNNTAIGFYSLHYTTLGWQNTSVGSYSLDVNITGSYNTAIGYNTGPNSENLFNTTCVGIDATATADNMVRIGNTFVTSIGGQVGWTTLSDGRFKEDVKEDVPGLAFITQLRPVSYKINRHAVNDFTGLNSRKQEQSIENTPSVYDNMTEPLSATTTGFIAQEVESAAQSIGFEFSGIDTPKNENDIYGLRYAEFVVPLVKAVQEQQDIIEDQQKQIDVLQKRIEMLEGR